jgi:hypothetical protein
VRISLEPIGRVMGLAWAALFAASCTCGKTGSEVRHPDAPLRGVFVPMDSSDARWTMTFPDDTTALLEIRTGDSVFQAVYSVAKSGTHEVNRSPE